MLHQLGYTSITALTRKPDSFELLKELGVSECLLVEDFLATPVKALMKQRFAFAIDTTGGKLLLLFYHNFVMMVVQPFVTLLELH